MKYLNAIAALQKMTLTAMCGLFVMQATAQDLLSYVQPLSGTASSTTISANKHSEAGSEKNANTIPAVGWPFGMTQWTPQTRLTENKCIPPYYFRDTLLYGFRGTHWLSGSCTQDYGSFTIMPVTGTLKTRPQDYAIPFSHERETARPHYYRIELPAAGLVAEMTASLRCGMLEFTASRDDSLYLLILPNSDKGKGFVRVDTATNEIWGYNPVYRIYQGWGQPAGFNGWFFIVVQKKIGVSGTFSHGEIFPAHQIGDKPDCGAYIGFKMKKGETLRVQIGTSFSGKMGAIRNFGSEMAGHSFTEILHLAEQAWQRRLGSIQVTTDSEKDKRVFYTALYHSFQLPRLFNDVDGYYPRFGGTYQLMGTTGSNYYDDFSMWDIYRAQLPLLGILRPSLVNQFVRSMISKGRQGGWLPVFPCWNNYTAAMIGDHVTVFIASAWQKGIRDYDVAAAYRLMRKNAFEQASGADYANGKGRRALSSYLAFGYIPLEDSVPGAFHKNEQVSRTLEYAYDDYALGVLAKALGKKEDYQKLSQRAMNYRLVYDSSVKMMRGRFSDGRWAPSFHPDQRERYITEGTPRQYTFYVPQDVTGLAQLMGGPRMLMEALDSLFARDEYWHGNEPGHQIPFMYNYTPAPWKTQAVVRKILREEYSDGPGGLSGNDDAGQMSAWYIFASMGFYPVDPVSNQYAICSPLFDQVELRLPGDKKFLIVTHNNTPGNFFIQKMMLNGKEKKSYFLTHEEISRGGRLELWLGGEQPR